MTLSDELIRVLLADDHAVVRAGLKAVIGNARDMLVVGEASSGPEAVAMAERLKPTVVVMDLSIGEVDGGQATKMLIEKGVPSRVLILTMHPEEEYLVPMLEAGASGFLPKTAADAELLDAIRAVARGDIFVRAQAARILAKGYQRKDPMQEERSRYERLTERERDVVKLFFGIGINHGLTLEEIGAKFDLTRERVRQIKEKAIRRLRHTSRSKLLKAYLG